MFKTVIVAIDGSEHSKKALHYAQELADRFNATLCLVHAFPHTSDLLAYDDFEKLISQRKAAGQEILDEARHILGKTRFTVEEELLEGPEAEAILTVAKAYKADLIVMGTRGRSSLEGLIFGSVSNKVVHLAPCPVMVVR